MTSKYLVTALLFSLVVCISANAIGFQFVLTEDDYRGEEGGTISAGVFRKFGSNNDDVLLNIKTATAQQAVAMGYALPEAFERYDPAEENDFTALDMNITFSPSEFTQFFEIPLTADDINEPMEEAFLILLTVVEASERDSGIVGETDIAIGLIEDDDDIKLSFTTDTLVVSEDAQSFELTIEKEGGRTTEQTLTVNVDAFTHDATLNLDFRFPDSAEQNVLTILPSEQQKKVLVVIMEDEEFEEIEHFAVDLVVAEEAKYSIGRNDRVLVFIGEQPPATDPTPNPITNPSPAPLPDCPDVGVAIGITFLLTFLLMTLLALVLVILAIICDRKHRRKLEQAPSTSSPDSQSGQQLP